MMACVLDVWRRRTQQPLADLDLSGVSSQACCSLAPAARRTAGACARAYPGSVQCVRVVRGARKRVSRANDVHASVLAANRTRRACCRKVQYLGTGTTIVPLSVVPTPYHINANRHFRPRSRPSGGALAESYSARNLSPGPNSWRNIWRQYSFLRFDFGGQSVP